MLGHESGERENKITSPPRRTAAAKQPKSGEVVAALAAVWLGAAALTAAHWWSAADPAQANPTLLRWGSWLPAGLRIGPYAGKEMAALVVWLGSWLVLFFALKRVELNLKLTMYVFIGAMLLLWLLLWPPVYHRIFGWPA
ncbi:hypothetical protein [Paenibacillus xerothermodurans]|uniref:Uncharacterized protein n=1 Tax=Paenibacillus xerothermodurans TaxID=1977292 RepID=A0A2W1NRE1_PAEXE|nr:hypothetical protein [Paenibacillus xerothermodurans]PZE22095.1 hypothetical protein CBW46_006815 [Paenibacillus xerothermodurans]